MVTTGQCVAVMATAYDDILNSYQVPLCLWNSPSSLRPSRYLTEDDSFG